MAEQVFRSPGFFEREIDLSERESEITGVPAGIIGASQMGPAFVPVTIGSFSDFVNKFGESNPDKGQFGPFAVKEFLKNRTAATFIRVLGAGTNETAADFEATRLYGYVKNAGFTVIGDTGATQGDSGGTRAHGGVKFIVASHFVSASGEGVAYPQFSDNSTFDLASHSNLAHLVRGMVFLATGTDLQILSADNKLTSSFTPDVGSLSQDPSNPMYKKFKLVISSSAGASFGSDEGFAGVRILTASLDPSSDAYISKILNTDPTRFQQQEHLLYGDFAVESEVAEVSYATSSVGIASGSLVSNPISSVPYQDLYGRFDSRYRAARTTDFISQPFGGIAGGKEYSLFSFETISDGAVVNDRFKISIANVKKSTDPENPYGSFTVLVRNFDDSDTNIQILEQYGNCTLDPNDESYIAKKIGDFKTFYNFDAGIEKERRVVISGKYPNVSSRIRVLVNRDVQRKDTPPEALPFGFKGLPVPKTLNEAIQGTGMNRILGGRLHMSGVMLSGLTGAPETPLSSSILPPVPLTFKCTRGNIDPLDGTFDSSGPVGHPGQLELADARYYWGVKTTRVPRTGSLSKAIFNPNANDEVNPLVRSYTKFLGFGGMDALVTGSGADEFNNNKFTLAKVALGNRKDSYGSVTKTVWNYLTASAGEHMREAAYIRNNASTASDGTINDGVTQGRLTLLSLMSLTSSVYFNKFSNFAKFTNIFYGGFDGVNILDPDMASLNDRAASSDAQGKANSSLNIGLYSYPPSATDRGEAFTAGIGKTNNYVNSYRAAIKAMTDPMISRVNIIAIPGQRDEFVTDYALSRLSDYGRAIYLMDIPSYTSDTTRIFDNDGKRPDTEATREKFESRGTDSSFTATYYPDISLRDTDSGRVVACPSSIAALSALGFNDSISYPWFAPAGFNRAALNDVVNVSVRLNKADRDDLYDSKINPIASFPGAGFVIFGQKTLQQAKSALDRVNVRRMLLEVKRLVENIANTYVFEQNTPTNRSKFVSQITPLLATIQSQQGVDQFKVTMDETNNTQADIEANKLNGQIRIVPTRAVEFIAIDFIITNSGVSFE